MNVGSRLGIYEFLTMFVSGTLILFMVLYLIEPTIFTTCGCKCYCSRIPTGNKGLDVFLFSLFSFTVGLIWHRFIEFIRGLWSGKCKMVRLFFGTIFCRNYNLGIEYVRKNVKESLGHDKDVAEKSPDIRNDYYKAYDDAMKTAYGNTIRQLEIQEAFIRDMWIPILVFVVLLAVGKIQVIDLNKEFWWIIIGLLLLILILIARYQTQMNIFRSVWEVFYASARKNEKDEKQGDAATK